MNLFVYFQDSTHFMQALNLVDRKLLLTLRGIGQECEAGSGFLHALRQALRGLLVKHPPY